MKSYARIFISEVPAGQDAADYIQLQINAAAKQVDLGKDQLVKVIIADGTYEMTSRINVPTGVSVAGESQENTILKISSDYTSGSSALFRTNDGSSFAGVERLTIDVNEHPTAGGVRIGGGSDNQSVLNINYVGNPDNANEPHAPVISLSLIHI